MTSAFLNFSKYIRQIFCNRFPRNGGTYFPKNLGNIEQSKTALRAAQRGQM